MSRSALAFARKVETIGKELQCKIASGLACGRIFQGPIGHSHGIIQYSIMGELFSKCDISSELESDICVDDPGHRVVPGVGE